MAVLGAVCVEEALPWAGCNCVWTSLACALLGGEGSWDEKSSPGQGVNAGGAEAARTSVAVGGRGFLSVFRLGAERDAEEWAEKLRKALGSEQRRS